MFLFADNSAKGVTAFISMLFLQVIVLVSA